MLDRTNHLRNLTLNELTVLIDRTGNVLFPPFWLVEIDSRRFFTDRLLRLMSITSQEHAESYVR